MSRQASIPALLSVHNTRLFLFMWIYTENACYTWWRKSFHTKRIKTANCRKVIHSKFYQYVKWNISTATSCKRKLSGLLWALFSYLAIWVEYVSWFESPELDLLRLHKHSKNGKFWWSFAKALNARNSLFINVEFAQSLPLVKSICLFLK